VRFHLIDRIDAWEPGRRIRGAKLTSRSEAFWRPGPGGEEMPEVLVLESLLQAGTWLVMLTTQRRKRAALLSVGSARFCGAVVPGDVLEIEVEIASMTDEAVLVSGHVTVDGRPVLEAADVMCALMDAAALEDHDATLRMEQTLWREAA
jgi:3-hydroxyacyl-[acyl-carrier-protein] dehydratase